MTRRAFCNTWRRGHQFPCVSRGQRRANRRCGNYRRRVTWQRYRLLLLFSEPDVFSYALAEARECRNQHPKPPPTSTAPTQNKRNEQKGDAYKDILERVLDAGFALTAFPHSSSRPTVVFHDRRLTGQCLWNQTDIGATHATKTGAINILCCTLGAKHFFLRSKSPSGP